MSINTGVNVKPYARDSLLDLLDNLNIKTARRYSFQAKSYNQILNQMVAHMNHNGLQVQEGTVIKNLLEAVAMGIMAK